MKQNLLIAAFVLIAAVMIGYGFWPKEPKAAPEAVPATPSPFAAEVTDLGAALRRLADQNENSVTKQGLKEAIIQRYGAVPVYKPGVTDAYDFVNMTSFCDSLIAGSYANPQISNSEINAHNEVTRLIVSYSTSATRNQSFTP